MAEGRESEFLEIANPHSWLLVADDLFDQAKEIWTRRGDNMMVHNDCMSGEINKMDRIDRSVILLCGFAIENLLKALLIIMDPRHIADAKLSKQLTKNHDLLRLVDALSLPVSREQRTTLGFVSDGIAGWARYPCGKSLQDSKSLQPLQESSFDDIDAVVKWLRRSIMISLSNGWRSHLGNYGVWSFSDGF